MRRLNLDGGEWISKEVFHLMSLCLSSGVVCPELRDLDLQVDYNTLPFHRLLLSPRLTRLSLRFSTSPESSETDLSMLKSVVMELGALPLQYLYLRWWIPGEASREIESVTSSAVLQCGPTLESLSTFLPLSDTAVQHIMQLPNLRVLSMVSRPPRPPSLSLHNIFPRLEYLSLGEEGSLEWLTFFTTTMRRTSSGQSSHPSLKHGPVARLINLLVNPRVIIDTAFISPIVLFRELAFLKLTSACSPMGGCAFSLTDDNVAEIATALPRLEHAVLGRVCSANSCQTTVASLVSFSTQCKGLEFLGIHFNTANLRNDLDSVSADPRFGGLPTPRTFGDFHLSLAGAPYKIGKDDVIPVLRGFRRIFPSLANISGNSASWKELNQRLPEM